MDTEHAEDSEQEEDAPCEDPEHVEDSGQEEDAPCEDPEHVEDSEQEEDVKCDVEPLLSRESASIARDTDALIKKWWEESRPRRRGAIRQAPRGTRFNFERLFRKWLEARGLQNTLEREPNQQGFAVFRYTRTELTPEQNDWEIAFHGTRWYALWLILTSGVMLQSDDREMGHDFWEPGVYCTPVLETARWYGRPHVLFNDRVYYRCIIELRVDPTRRKRARQRGGVQWVFPEDAVVIRGVWVQINSSVAVDDQRFVNWDPTLEAIPSSRDPVEAIVNHPSENQGMEDEDDDGEQSECSNAYPNEESEEEEEYYWLEEEEEEEEYYWQSSPHESRLWRLWQRDTMTSPMVVPMRGSVACSDQEEPDSDDNETPVKSIARDHGVVPMRGSVACSKQEEPDSEDDEAPVKSIAGDHGAIPMRGSVAYSKKEESDSEDDEASAKWTADLRWGVVPMRGSVACSNQEELGSEDNETPVESVVEDQGGILPLQTNLTPSPPLGPPPPKIMEQYKPKGKAKGTLNKGCWATLAADGGPPPRKGVKRYRSKGKSKGSWNKGGWATLAADDHVYWRKGNQTTCEWWQKGKWLGSRENGGELWRNGNLAHTQITKPPTIAPPSNTNIREEDAQDIREATVVSHSMIVATPSHDSLSRDYAESTLAVSKAKSASIPVELGGSCFPWSTSAPLPHPTWMLPMSLGGTNIGSNSSDPQKEALNDNSAVDDLLKEIEIKKKRLAEKNNLECERKRRKLDEEAICEPKTTDKVEEGATCETKITDAVKEGAICEPKITDKVEEGATCETKVTDKAEEAATCETKFTEKVEEGIICETKITDNVEEGAICETKITNKVEVTSSMDIDFAQFLSEIG